MDLTQEAAHERHDSPFLSNYFTQSPLGALRSSSTSMSWSPLAESTDSPLGLAAMPYRHAAVRQSSMLRFAQTAASQSSDMTETDNRSSPIAAEYEHERIGVLCLPPRRLRSYRPRSRSYSFVQSEADTESDSNHSEAKDCQAVHSSYSKTPQEPSSSPRDSSPSLFSGTHCVDSLPIRRRVTPMSQKVVQSPKSESDLESSHDDFASRGGPSTPSSRDSELRVLLSHDIPSDRRSEDPLSGPHTPSNTKYSPNRLVDSLPLTSSAPPPPSRRGDALHIYDDRLSALAQPQTPADISRHAHVTPYQAAYTAPPGQGRTLVNPRIRTDNSSVEFSPTLQRIRLSNARPADTRTGHARFRQSQRDPRVGTALDGMAGADAVDPGLEEWHRHLDRDAIGEENVSYS